MKAFWPGGRKKKRKKKGDIGAGVGPTERHMLLSVPCSSVT